MGSRAPIVTDSATIGFRVPNIMDSATVGSRAPIITDSATIGSVSHLKRGTECNKDWLLPHRDHWIRWGDGRTAESLNP